MFLEGVLEWDIQKAFFIGMIFRSLKCEVLVYFNNDNNFIYQRLNDKLKFCLLSVC